MRGWVVEADVATPDGVDLLPLKSWLGLGPAAEVVELADWAVWRWAGPASFFLHVASPSVVVRALPKPPPMPAAPIGAAQDDAAAEWVGDLAAAGRRRWCGSRPPPT